MRIPSGGGGGGGWNFFWLEFFSKSANGRDLVEIWSRSGRDLVEIWWNFGRDLVEIWFRFGRGSVKIGQEMSRNVEVALVRILLHDLLYNPVFC